jgi:hypothetical protein
MREDTLIENTDMTHRELYQWTESIALKLREAGVSRLIYHKETMSEESIIFVKEIFQYLNLSFKCYSRSVIYKEELDLDLLNIILAKLRPYYPSAKTALKGISLVEDCYYSFYTCFRSGVVDIGYHEILEDMDEKFKKIVSTIDDSKELLINYSLSE